MNDVICLFIIDRWTIFQRPPDSQKKLLATKKNISAIPFEACEIKHSRPPESLPSTKGWVTRLRANEWVHLNGRSARQRPLLFGAVRVAKNDRWQRIRFRSQVLLPVVFVLFWGLRSLRCLRRLWRGAICRLFACTGCLRSDDAALRFRVEPVAGFALRFDLVVFVVVIGRRRTVLGGQRSTNRRLQLIIFTGIQNRLLEPNTWMIVTSSLG